MTTRRLPAKGHSETVGYANSQNVRLARPEVGELPTYSPVIAAAMYERAEASASILRAERRSAQVSVDALVAFTILGQPYSKSNQRKIVEIAGRPSSIKSKKALAYEKSALQQIPPRCRLRLTGELSMTIRIFYESERPDLDETLILDILQDRFKTVTFGGVKSRELVQAGVYQNDRQVRERHVYHAIDKKNPRAVIELRRINAELFV